MDIRTHILIGCLSALMLAGCQSAYYGTMEKLGYHKREILSNRVEEARDSQEAAKEQFASALEAFRGLVQFDGGELEDRYATLNRAYERSKKRADAVSQRIEAVEQVARALFLEWEAELDDYTNAELRRLSEEQLATTEAEYDGLLRAMKRAESKMPPVLNALKDQVLFLKHNLNARAIASLQGELGNVESNVATLITEMETAIAEANDFITQMK